MVVATGFFDGIHLGHRLVLEQLVKAAAVRGGESMVVTFWPHPRNVLQKEARTLRLLTSLQEKKESILSIGVSRVEVLPFTKEFSSMTTKEYLTMLMDKFGVKAVLVGYDNRMGCDAKDSDQVAEIATGLGLEVIRTGMVPSDHGYAVSSTKIRKKLEEGDVAGAAQMLGYEFSIRGVVVAGNRLGRTIGFPTANVQVYEPLKLIPGNGVYVVRVRTLGKEFMGMCNIGYKPTVGQRNARTIEANIFDFDEDIYGLDIELTFVDKIRDEIKFDSLDSLREQLEKDKMECLKI